MENKIRIQPKMVEIPKDDPFGNDLLDRKTPIEALTNVISNIEGPCVMAVDAPWGMGKTTFIRMWEQHLRKQKFLVASFNAWETDYFADPFSALSGELLQELGSFEENLSVDENGSAWQKKLKKLKGLTHVIYKKTRPVLHVLADTADPSGSIKAAVQTIEACAEETSGSHQNAPEKRTEDAPNSHQNTREERKEFRKTLGEVAGVFTQNGQRHPLVIIIDELDRCRPSYAVELLEIAKHFFSMDHIVFVLAVNFSELSHSVQAVYGEKFNARGYLDRFFDIDFKLPDTNRGKFIQSNLEAMKIDQYFMRTADERAKENFPTIVKVFSAFFTKAGISLRRISQVMRRLGLIIAALPSDQPFLGWASGVALIVRTIDFELYERFIRRNVSDQKVVDAIFSRPELAGIRNRHEGNLFEAVIVAAYVDMRTHEELQTDGPSPLYQTYRKLAELDPKIPVDDERARKRAPKIMKMVEILSGEEVVIGGGLHFQAAIERIELFSANLAQENASQN